MELVPPAEVQPYLAVPGVGPDLATVRVFPAGANVGNVRIIAASGVAVKGDLRGNVSYRSRRCLGTARRLKHTSTFVVYIVDERGVDACCKGLVSYTPAFAILLYYGDLCNSAHDLLCPTWSCEVPVQPRPPKLVTLVAVAMVMAAMAMAARVVVMEAMILTG